MTATEIVACYAIIIIAAIITVVTFVSLWAQPALAVESPSDVAERIATVEWARLVRAGLSHAAAADAVDSLYHLSPAFVSSLANS